MAYYVGAINKGSRWAGIESTPANATSDYFFLRNRGTALLVYASRFLSANYDLPQGAILARIYINGQTVVEDVPVLDKVVANETLTHYWRVEYDLAAADVEKLSGGQPLHVNQVRVAFYVNEEGLRGVTIAERDRSNAFDAFRQEVQTETGMTGNHTFVFTRGVRHDFTTATPYEDYLYTYVDETSFNDSAMNGYRMVVTPLFDANGFAMTSLFKIEVYNAYFDSDGKQAANENPSLTYSFTLSGMQLSLSYANEFQKTEQTVGPFNYGQDTSYRAAPALIDDLPATTYANHALTLDPGGVKGFYFLDATNGRIGFSADLLVGEFVLQLSLSSYFSISRDVTKELLVEVHSDVSLAASLLS